MNFILKYLNRKRKKFLSLYIEVKKVNKDRNKGLKLIIISLFQTIKTILKAKIKCDKQKKYKHEFEYYFRENKYKIFINTNKNQISRIMDVIDENNKDITEKIKEYAGPFENFHHMDITPKMLNYKKIIIKVFNEEEMNFQNYEFNENDILNIDEKQNKNQDNIKENNKEDLLNSEEDIDVVYFHTE